MSITAEAKAYVQTLLQQGKKIEAVKYLSETFQISLIESKTLVETLENETIEALLQPKTETADTATLRNDIANLLKQGNKIEAVKLAKETYGSTLKEALEYVDDIEFEMGSGGTSPPTAPGLNVFKLVGTIFASIGVLLIIIAGFIYQRKNASVEKSVKVPGVVTEYHGNYAPVVDYIWEGKKKRYYSDVYSSPPAYDIDEEVTMLVNREDPSDVMIDSFSDRWIAIVILGGLGTFFFLFGSLFVYFGRKV